MNATDWLRVLACLGMGRSYTMQCMSVTVEISDDVATRLKAEAVRRGITTEELLVDLTAELPNPDAPASPFSFAGIGRSGYRDLGRRHRELRTQEIADLSARDF